MNKLQISLLIALIMLPLSGALIHLKVHPDIQWLLYLTLFDAIVVTGLFVFNKTRIYGFWINTILGLAGVIYHAQFSLVGTLSDTMLIVADVMIGYALLTVFGQTMKGRKK